MKIRKKGLIVAAIATSCACWFGSAGADEVAVPASGTVIVRECDDGRRTSKIIGAGAGSFKAESRSGYRVAPVWAYVTGIVDERVRDGQMRSKYELMSGSLAGVRHLKVGSTFTADYRSVGRSGSFEQTHRVDVKEERVLDTRAFGRQRVIVVEHTIKSWNGDFTSSQVSYFAPELNAIVYSKYSEHHQRSNRSSSEECHLSEIRQP